MSVHYLTRCSSCSEIGKSQEQSYTGCGEMNAACNCVCRLGVTWGPDPDWDPLTSVWVSTDTRGLNLYPLTSCCVQNHVTTFLCKVWSLSGSIKHKEWRVTLSGKQERRLHLEAVRQHVASQHLPCYVQMSSPCKWKLKVISKQASCWDACTYFACISCFCCISLSKLLFEKSLN